MRRSGIGLVMLLIVVLLVAFLMAESMTRLRQPAPAGAGAGKNPVEQAQSVVDMANARIGQYTDRPGGDADG